MCMHYDAVQQAMCGQVLPLQKEAQSQSHAKRKTLKVYFVFVILNIAVFLYNG